MYVLGQMLTPDLRARVWGEATTFGDEWLECETRGNGELEIVFLPPRSQAVPVTAALPDIFLKDSSEHTGRL